MAADQQARRQATPRRFPPEATLLPDPGEFPLPLIRTKESEEALRRDAAFAAGRNIWTGQPVEPARSDHPDPTPLRRTWLDQSPTAKALGAGVGVAAGVPAGVSRGVWHAERDTVSALAPVMALGPLYPSSRFGRDAADGILLAEAAGLQYAKSRIANPHILTKDLNDGLSRLNRTLNPFAIPLEGTFPEAVARGFDVGKNDGEAVFDLGSLFVAGGGAAKGVALATKPSKAARMALYMARDARTEAQAERLARPYSGMDHHFLARSYKIKDHYGPFKVPEPLVGQSLPKWFLESDLNRLRPLGMDTQEHYTRHFEVDPDFWGAKLPDRGGWRGRELGLKKRGDLGRLVYGSPTQLKAAVIGGPLAVGGLAYGAFGGDD